MEFVLPKRYQGLFTVKIEAPLNFRRYVIEGALQRHVRFPGGEWLSQEVPGRNFSFWDHRLLLKEDICLYAYFKSLCMTINYNLKGSLNCNLGGDRVLLQEAVYNFYCVQTKVFHPCYFKAGVYRFFHLDMKDDLLDSIKFNPLCRDAILAYLENPRTQGTQLDPCSITPVVNNIIRDIEACADTDKVAYDVAMAHHAGRLIHEFNKQMPREQKDEPSTFGKKLVAKVVLYINGNLEKPLKVNSLSELFGVTPKTLNKHFYKEMEVILTLYIYNQRMLEGRRLLLTTTDLITDIALSLGYNEECNFARDYYEKFGHNPKKEREIKL